MNEIKNISEEITPHLALVFYNAGINNVYVESGKVVNNKITAVQPLSENALKEVMKLVNIKPDKEFTCSKFIPRCVVGYNKNRIIWTANIGEVEIAVYGEKYTVDLQKMVFVYNQHGGLNVYTVPKDTKELSEDTELYHTPLPNINKYGGMCWGSVKRPKVGEISLVMKYVEKLFIESEFTHYNHENYSTFWWEKSKSVKLVKSGKTLKDIL